MTPVTAQTLRAWIADGAELALLDAREEAEFGRAHPFWATPCPLSQAELRLPTFLPRPDVRIVCIDDGGGLAQRLAGLVEARGGGKIQILENITAAWPTAGGVLFSGVNVPSKAFGEWVEHHYATPSIDAAELQSWIEGGKKIEVLDSRPFDEFTRMSIPTGRCVPGGELAYRIADLVPDPATTVVVNCAGRTRSILGAESLRRAGIPNPVLALRNGTMGWRLAGLDTARGETATYTPGTPRSAAAALARAQVFARAAGVCTIDAATLARFEADPTRTTYVLDVRAPAEYAAGHHPGSRNAPGGQLVQATDRWIAVRGARICLLDDTGPRALMAAAWLRQMGFRDVFTASLGGTLLSGSEPTPTPPDAPLADVGQIPGALVIDLARSTEFREAHIPGAIWGLRSRLALRRDPLAAASRVILTSSDGTLARWAVAEAQSLTAAPVAALAGGTAGWPHPLAASRDDPPDDSCLDAYLRPYDRNSGIEAAMRDYLSWEIDLVHEVERDGQAQFGV